jgi:hypothetical protein
LLQPKVVTRSAYPIGRKPTMSTLLPFYLHFNTTMTCRADVPAYGQDLLAPQLSTLPYFGTRPHVWTLPVAPDNCGKFSTELRLHYSLAPPSNWQPYPTNPLAQFLYDLRDRIRPRRRSTESEEKPYQVGFRVPVDINVVPEAEAEQVQLLSSPELDNRMKEMLRPDMRAWRLHIFARRLPANVVFGCFLVLPDGTRIRSRWPENRHLTGYAGRDFEASLWTDEYKVDRAHVREAKFVFETDPNYAFEEPTIKSIWNGRLEFPIQLAVPPEPNTGG